MPQRIKKNKREYTGHFLDRGKWWVAWTDEVSGAVTQGRTLREARENLKDAIALMLEPVDQKPFGRCTPVAHDHALSLGARGFLPV
jgi:predicted RNase H-like HicB family nuclease